MGVIYKIKPEIRERIIQEAKAMPELGCRRLSIFIKEQFKIDISKSSINSILKAEGIRFPVGRRRYSGSGVKQLPIAQSENILLLDVPHELTQIPLQLSCHDAGLKKQLPAQEEPIITESFLASASNKSNQNVHYIDKLGYWFLKAADLCLGGMEVIAHGVSRGIRKDAESSESAMISEGLFYLSLLGARDINEEALQTLNMLTEKPCDAGKLNMFKESLDCDTRSLQEIARQLHSCLISVRGIKFILEDGASFFIDPQGHSMWPACRSIPRVFSFPSHAAKEYVKRRLFLEAQPFVLQAPPGFGTLQPVFLSFLEGCEGKPGKRFERVEYYGLRNELIDTVSVELKNPYYYITGIWPWQFNEIREEAGPGIFTPFACTISKDSFALAETTLFLTPKSGDKPLALRSIILKRNQGKVISLITNINRDVMNATQIASAYLSQWPTLELGYSDFLNKSKQPPSLSENQAILQENMKYSNADADISLNKLFNFWFQKLNDFCLKYLFPENYSSLDIKIIKERFYNMPGIIKAENNDYLVVFNVQSDSEYMPDFNYACQRLNEAGIYLSDGRRLRFGIA